MNPSKLRRKRVWIPILAAVVALGVGGTVWASSASADQGLKVIAGETDDDHDDRDDANDTPEADDRALSASERSSASRAATTAVGGGTVTDVEASDDRGVGYEVEVRQADGTEWDVDLDSSFAVVHKGVDR